MTLEEIKIRILSNKKACLFLWEIQNVNRTFGTLGLNDDSEIDTGEDVLKHEAEDTLGNLADIFMDFILPEMDAMDNEEYYKHYDFIKWDIFMNLRLKKVNNKWEYFFNN